MGEGTPALAGVSERGFAEQDDFAHLLGGYVGQGVVLEVAGGVVVDGADDGSLRDKLLARFDPLTICIYYISFLCRSYFFIIRNTLLRR